MIMNGHLQISYLADHPEVIPTLQEWFETEWAAYYGPGGPGCARHDLVTYAARDQLPVGLIASIDGQLCGIAALKADSLSTHTHLGPWVAAGLVAPAYRRRGIGARLIARLEDVARHLGYLTIYAGTSTATSLLERCGWQFMERIRYDGEDVSIYQKVLGPR
jgi:GNAT superfamily N-acetyltransferase